MNYPKTYIRFIDIADLGSKIQDSYISDRDLGDVPY